ncbi:MAG: hypothetical protein AAF723_05105, partial [Pseudomonadota bacterium]
INGQGAADAPLPMLTVTDSLGRFDGSVWGLALWQHPREVFKSAVMAANGPAGLFLIPMDQAAPSQLTGDFTASVAVTYVEGTALAVAYDQYQDSSNLRFFAIDDQDRVLVPLASSPVQRPARALCFAGLNLIQIDDEGSVSHHRLALEGGRLSMATDALNKGPSYRDCASDGEHIYLLQDNGRVVIQPVGAGNEPASDDLPSFPEAIAMEVMPTQSGPIFIALQPNGSLLMNDQSFALKTIEGEEVKPSQFALGSGNFGTVYRDGAIAILTDENALYLLPWLGVQTALDIEAPSISLRTLSSARENTSLTPSLDLPPLGLTPQAAPLQE